MNKIALVFLAFVSTVGLMSCTHYRYNKVLSSYKPKYEYVNKEGKVIMTSKPNKNGIEEFEYKGYNIEGIGQVYLDTDGEVVVSQITDAIMKKGTGHTAMKYLIFPRGQSRYLFKEEYNDKTITFNTKNKFETPLVTLDYSKDKFMTITYHSLGYLSWSDETGVIIVDIENNEVKYTGTYKGEGVLSGTLFKEIPQQRLVKAL